MTRSPSFLSDPFPALLVLAVPAFFALAGCGDAGRSAAAGGSDELLAGQVFDFVDVAAEAGLDQVNVCGDARRWYIPEGNGNGAAWLDYDGDGDADLFLPNGGTLRYPEEDEFGDGVQLEVLLDAPCKLYRNDGGMRFTDVTAQAGPACTRWVNAVATGDVDNDGDPDLYLACFGGDVFFINDGGRFVEATAAAGLGNELWGAGASFGDVDNDGDLDLYVANYCMFDPAAPPNGGKPDEVPMGDGQPPVLVGLGPEEENKRGFNVGAPDRFYLGDGKGGFVEATAERGFGLDKDLCSYAVVFSDVDGDGWQDILVANDLQPCNLFYNLGDGRFEEQGLKRGFAFNAEGSPTAGMGLFVEDVDGDGDQDVYRTNFDMEANCLHINNGKGFFVDRADLFGLGKPSFDRLGWGGGFFDADCDGDYDLLVANGHVIPACEQLGLHGWAMGTQLFEGRMVGGRLRFDDASARAGSGLVPLRSARGVAFADADRDGDLDVLIVDLDAQPRLLENRTERRGDWLAVRLIGTESNRDSLGARVTVHVGERSWTREVRRTNGMYSSHALDLHFGLGSVGQQVLISARWPSGRELVMVPVDANQQLRLTEPDR